MVDNLAKKLDFSGSITPINNEPTEQPFKWCSVSLSEIVGRGNRLEASVYDVEGKIAREILAKSKYPLTCVGGEDGLTTSFTGARFKRIWLKKSDYPIYQPSSILDVKPTPDGYISHLTDTNIDALRVKKGQILITCSGTVGNCTLVSGTLDNCIFSHDLLRVNCKSYEDIGYLYTYFKSEIGKTILLTNGYGSVITHIESEHLSDIPIPNPPIVLKQKIHDLIMKSYALRDESNMLIDDATKLLVEELCLPDIDDFELSLLNKSNTAQTYSVKLSNISGRLEGSYHVPVVDSILKHLKQYADEVITVGDETVSKNIILAGVFKRVYVKKGCGIPFLGGKEITQLNPNIEKFLSKPNHQDRYEKELRVSKNMILVTDRGTIGTVIIVPEHFDGWAVSQNVLKLVPASEDIAGYIYIYLNCDIGKCLLKRETYGSVVDMIDNSSLSSVAFPLLKNKNIQNKINSLALEANEKRYEAYKLEQEALKIMNEEVVFA